MSSGESPPPTPPTRSVSPTTPIMQPGDLGKNDYPPAFADASPIGSSKQAFIPHLDNLFNFQLVVFQVENTLFQVLKNGFNVPGTIFEAMFALPVAPPEPDLTNLPVEGSTLDKPIHLTGVSAKDFRAFLRILYPFIGPSNPLTYDDWVGILKLSTMWDFQEIREKAISGLSTLIPAKTAPERIALGRTYRVSSWLRDEYVRLAQKTSLELNELRDPFGISLDWETIAKILSVREQNTLRNLQQRRISNSTRCYECSTDFGWSENIMDCRCNLPSVVESVFQEEFREIKEPAKEDSRPFQVPSHLFSDGIDEGTGGLWGAPVVASSGGKKKKKPASVETRKRW